MNILLYDVVVITVEERVEVIKFVVVVVDIVAVEVIVVDVMKFLIVVDVEGIVGVIKFVFSGVVAI